MTACNPRSLIFVMAQSGQQQKAKARSHVRNYDPWLGQAHVRDRAGGRRD